MNYDLIVIGGGPAGYTAAIRAGQAKQSVMIIEKNKLGGVCLNEGCVPSKSFLYSAKLLDNAFHGGEYGVVIPDYQSAYIDQKTVLARKNNIVNSLVFGVRGQLRKAKVNIVFGTAYIVKKAQNGFVIAVNGEEYTATRLLIATGSTPVIPPITGLNEALSNGFALTNREILNLDYLPDSLIIVGGGVIGLEMASYFSSAKTRVTVVEMLDKIGGATEDAIVSILQKTLVEKGVDFRLGCRVTEFKKSSIVYEKDGSIQEISADKVLVSIGRKPVTSGFGLENLGVKLEKGAIITNEKMMTSVANLYAAGDVNGNVMLAHTAYREAEVAVNNMLGNTDSINYNTIPSVIYTCPEVGAVGETLSTAIDKGYDAKEVKLSLAYSGRYVAENNTINGICKLVVDNTSNKLLGAHIIGSYASEFIVALSNLIDLDVDIERIKKLVFPHPTVCEIIREAVWAI